ncbi:MAG: AMP-binding protein, partial [Terracidiphilus sp.]
MHRILSLAFLSRARHKFKSQMTDAPNTAPRQSLVEFLRDFDSRRHEVAVAHRRGYRMERSTYGDILDEARRFARELESRGIAKSDAVLLWAEPSPAWIAAFFGCVLRGAVAVPVDQISTPEFVSRVAREVTAKLIVRSRGAAAVQSPVPTLEMESLLDTIAHHSASPYSSPALTRDDTLE